MLNVPSFSEDMLPRHFPKIKGQLEQNSSAAPLPTLPGLSLILDDESTVPKLETKPYVEPRQTFQQWKQQHEAIFIDNSTAQQRRSEKKQVRFEADNQTNCNFIEKVPNQRIPPSISPNLELSYYELPVARRENQCQNEQRNQYHHHPHHNSNTISNSEGSRLNSKSPTPFETDKAYNAAHEYQTTTDFPQINRIVRCESVKENCSTGNFPSVHKDERQCHSNCCQQGFRMNQTHLEIAKQPATVRHHSCVHGVESNGCISEHRERPSGHQDLFRGQIMNPHSLKVERSLRGQSANDDTLFSIMEEQQQHILMQQNQILMQQKQNMMQQQQICMLQHQVQQLLLRNESPNKSHQSQSFGQSTICNKTTATASPNAIRIRDASTEFVCNGSKTRSSIGVMTSFLGNMNDAKPNGIKKLNERFKSATKRANEKFIENIGGISTEEYSYKDSMLDKINDAIRNSSAMIDYRTRETTNGCVSPAQQSDINIAAQALIYESSSTNNGCMNEQKTTDRSFALYMLGMKYDCPQDDGSKKNDKRDTDIDLPSGEINDQVSVNISPEVYDYLKRHGLLKHE